MEVLHLVARTRCRDGSLAAFPLAADLWAGLRRAFPDALAAVIMPDHVHVVTSSASAAHARNRMRAVLSGARRHRCGAWLRWEPVPEPVVVADNKHLRRQIRYVVLNPCRSGLARDPLEWLWSTHRDAVGAAVDPWVTGARLASALGEAPVGFSPRWHAYISADPSVAIPGTPFPTAARPSDVARVPLTRIVAASAAAHRVPIAALARRGPSRSTFLGLAQASGWDRRTLVGTTVAASRTTAWRHRTSADISSAAWLCLGDPRLLACARPAAHHLWPHKS
jgi:hypothetical protein